MKDADLNYFCDKEIRQDEEITMSIECLHEGNPFVGSLILTNQRLVFVRKGDPGFEVLSIRSSIITNIEQRIDRGLDFILVVALDNFTQEFELRGMDMAGKRAFVDKAQIQFGLDDEKALRAG
jgi:hypothetical protein